MKYAETCQLKRLKKPRKKPGLNAIFNRSALKLLLSPSLGIRTSQSVINKFINKVLNLSVLESQLLVLIIKDAIIYNSIYKAQATYGLVLGTSREWVNRTMQVLEEKGLISKVYRYFQTCITSISRIFHYKQVIKVLSDYIPVLEKLYSISPRITQEDKSTYKLREEGSWHNNLGVPIHSLLNILDGEPPNIPKPSYMLPF